MREFCDSLLEKQQRQTAPDKFESMNFDDETRRQRPKHS
jgi:hypothetical protein